MLLILLNCSLVWGFVYSRVCYGGSFLTSYTHSPFHKAPHSLVDKLRLLRGLCPRSPRGSYGACISWAVSSRGILPGPPSRIQGLLRKLILSWPSKLGGDVVRGFQPRAPSGLVRSTHVPFVPQGTCVSLTVSGASPRMQRSCTALLRKAYFGQGIGRAANNGS